MMLKTALLTAAAVLALTACAATPNPNVVAAQTTCAQAYADPQLDPIRAKIPFGDSQASMATMAQLADSSKPNSFERSILQQYDAANRRCWDAWDRVGSSPYVQQARSAVATALAELYSGGSTFGDYNRKRANALAEMNARLREEEERQRMAYRSRVMFCDSWGGPGFRTLHCF